MSCLHLLLLHGPESELLSQLQVITQQRLALSCVKMIITGETTFLCIELRTVECLIEHLDSQLECIVQRGTLFVVLFEQRNGCLVVASDARGLPAAIVARRITLVELKSKVRVPAHVQDRHTKRTLPYIAPVHVNVCADMKTCSRKSSSFAVPPYCVYACLMSQSCITSCSTGMHS